ncbi:MAG: rod shape-determining protein [Planctomycetota bacterium]
MSFPFRVVRRSLCPAVAVDLGSARTRVAVAGRGLIVDEPSVVAVSTETGRVLGGGRAVGRVASQMLGRTPDAIRAVRPVRDGVVRDLELCTRLLRQFVGKSARGSFGLKPEVVVTVPSGLSPVERRAVVEAADRAGAGRVSVLEKSRAAALGVGLPLAEAAANFVCDIGAGTTDVAVLSLGGVVAARTTRAAGDACDLAIIEYVRRRHSLRIGVGAAERLKTEIGSAVPLETELTREVGGLDVPGGVPRRAVVTSEEIRQAIEGPLAEVVAAIRGVIESCDPELVGDLSESGLTLAGGTAALRGIDRYLADRVGLPVRIADEPARAACRGAAVCVDDLRGWRRLLDAAD